MINRLPERLYADATRVVIRPFNTLWRSTGAMTSRAQSLVDRVIALDEIEVEHLLVSVMADFQSRHWQIASIFDVRFTQTAAALGLDPSYISHNKQQLIGAYFCHEYSYAAAAIMNPSVTEHPDQSGLSEDSVRIIISLRTVGEGHISTIAFKEGIISSKGALTLGHEPAFATAAMPVGDRDVGAGDPVFIEKHSESTLTGTVIFPVTPAQSNGLEDLRLTCFANNGERQWVGTYTAYNGSQIRSELLITNDFVNFELRPMTGDAAVNKGMALFPRKIAGQYMMVGRQDGQNLFLLRSDTLSDWNGGQILLQPHYPWEFIQIGNCGPPIELDQGWLLLTHGVGAMRKYAIGAALLDKNDPSRVIARSHEPLLAAIDHEREGYVPNVVYTCGALRIGPKIFVPYALADSSVAFAFVDIDEFLKTLV